MALSANTFFYLFLLFLNNMEDIYEMSDLRTEAMLPLGAVQKVYYHQKANMLLFSIKG